MRTVRSLWSATHKKRFRNPTFIGLTRVNAKKWHNFLPISFLMKFDHICTIYGMFTTCSQFVQDLFMICLQVAHYSFMTFYYNFFTNSLELFHYFLWTASLEVLCLSYPTWTALFKLFHSKYFPSITLLILLSLNYITLFTSVEVLWSSHSQLLN